MQIRMLVEQWWPVVLKTGDAVFPFLWSTYKLYQFLTTLGPITSK